jgi:hypothetical protein
MNQSAAQSSSGHSASAASTSASHPVPGAANQNDDGVVVTLPEDGQVFEAELPQSA